MLSRPIQFGSAARDRSPDPKDVLVSELQRAIAQGNERDVTALVARAVREKQPIGTDAGELVGRACAAGSSLEIKKVLTVLPGFRADSVAADGGTPLNAAVAAGDIGFVRHLLQQGADPRKLPPSAAPSDEIAQLLKAAGTINALMSKRARNGRAMTPLAPLAQALAEYDLEQARTLLDEERAQRGDGSDTALWAHAAREKRSDIHCAMLVLCDPASMDELARPRNPQRRNVLELAMRTGNPALRSYLKQMPYYSHRFGRPKDLNMKAVFQGSENRIECRHLTLFWLHQRALAEKNGYAMLASAQSIARHVGPEFDHAARLLTGMANEIHLIDNRQWGQFLVRQFNAMQASSKPHGAVLRRQICLNSLTHTMGADLSIKIRPDGTKQYAVSIYDPNMTNVHKRAATGDLAVVGQWQFAAFLPSPAHEAAYFPEEEKLSSVFVVSGDNLAPAPPLGTPRRLSSGIAALTPTALHYLMTENLSGEISARKEEICAAVEGMDFKAAIAWLSAKDGLGMPALHAALNYGNAAAIDAYAEVVDMFDIQDEDLTELLAAKDERELPGLNMAMQEGHTDAVAAFGRMAKRFQLSNEQLTQLLECRNADGVAGLEKALRQGHISTVEMFGKIVADAGLPHSDHANLLAVPDADGVPALHVAMENGDVAAMWAFGNLVRQSGLPGQYRRELLLARNSWGQPALAQIDLGTRPEVPETFHEMVVESGLDDNERDALDEVLAGYRFAGGPGSRRTGDAAPIDAAAFHDLLHSGHADVLQSLRGTVTAYLKGRSPQEAEEWLAARDSDGAPALHVALKRGQADAVTAFGAILHELRGLPPRQVAQLLIAADASDTPGLHAALVNGQVETVEAFGEILLATNLPGPYTMAVLLAENAEGTPGVVVASDAGDDDTVHAYYRILDRSGMRQQYVEELERVIDGYQPAQ